MKHRIIIYNILFFVLFLLESCTGPVFGGLNPGYLLAGVCCVALLEGERFGAVYGIIFGLLRDFSVGSLFGLHGILFLVFGYSLGFLSKTVLSANVFTCIVTCTVACGLCEALAFLCESMLIFVPLTFAVQTILLPKLVMNFPTCILLYFFIRCIRNGRRLPGQRRVG